MKRDRGRVAVTGSAGRAGQVVVHELLDNGHEVVSIDVVPWAASPCPHLQADLSNLGECFEVLSGCEAVVHLAGVFGAGIRTPESTFRINITSTFNVFQASAALALRRVVWASTSAVVGAPFGEVAPPYLPLTESCPFNPSTSYAMAKALGEVMMQQSRLWNGVTFVALRFAWIFTPRDYEEIPSFWGNPDLRKFNLWAYLDVHDAARACMRALESDVAGSSAYFITAADTVMDRPSEELATGAFPGTRLAQLSGNQSLFSIAKAHDELGWHPEHSWRDYLEARATT
jgi:nucleoside-diphosphate-sugar epimerase